ncbi:SDR family oxidoreductase [Segetibacter sp.]|jgi:NAD(P)-dependent dehydrogenase (short-subunit alcohol dehydrogenase family)|uniref:SDR family oxidoreductase n=1 Tax=Segetibacter sp. TaxID=2231182 RepID=UPI0026050D07|nr:SDR family oxidoreductase [Segetibacter sp.]MCW3079512.1 D-mannonate oxidoreductase [Segetibacter sp.]
MSIAQQNKYFNLKEKVIVVTGATGILGDSFVNGLVDMEARVVLLGRNEAVGEERMNALKEKGGEAIFIKTDVLSRAELEHARDITLNTWGKIDGLVNAAGGNVPEAVVAPGADVFDLDMDALKRAFDLNLYGTILPTCIFGKAMTQTGRGSIVNISSMAAQSAITRVLGYSMAKAGIDNYTRWMCVELAQRYGDSIRINAIAPGFFVTNQNRHLLVEKEGYTSRGEAVIRNTPFKRFGNADELIGTLIWLLSDASVFVSGEVICVDGGFHVFSGV